METYFGYFILLLSTLIIFYSIRVSVIFLSTFNRFKYVGEFQMPTNYNYHKLILSVRSILAMALVYFMLINSNYESNILRYLICSFLTLVLILQAKETRKYFPSSNIKFISYLRKPYDELIFNRKSNKTDDELAFEKKLDDLKLIHFGKKGIESDKIIEKLLINLNNTEFNNLEIDKYIHEDDKEIFRTFIINKIIPENSIKLINTNAKNYKKQNILFLSKFLNLKEIIEIAESLKCYQYDIVDFINSIFEIADNEIINLNDIKRYT